MTNFKFKNMTLTQLGELFGVSSHQVGNWLVEIGFRTEDKRPSKCAFERKIVSEGPSRGQGYNWIWKSGDTVASLEAAGHKRVFPAPPDLIVPPPLIGPFCLKTGSGGNFRIENKDGETVLVGQGDANGKSLYKVLEVADRHFFNKNIEQPKSIVV